jgi:hypothetical protein
VEARVDNGQFPEDVMIWPLRNGVDLDEYDITGRRPMQLAINAEYLDLMKPLLTKRTARETLDHQEMDSGYLYY